MKNISFITKTFFKILLFSIFILNFSCTTEQEDEIETFNLAAPGNPIGGLPAGPIEMEGITYPDTIYTSWFPPFPTSCTPTGSNFGNNQAYVSGVRLGLEDIEPPASCEGIQFIKNLRLANDPRFNNNCFRIGYLHALQYGDDLEFCIVNQNGPSGPGGTDNNGNQF